MTDDKTVPTVGNQVLRALVDAVEEAGGSRAAFLHEIGRGEADLSATGPRVPLHEVAGYCDRALEISGDPALGLHWAEHLSARAFGPVSHLISHTATLRAGFEQLAQFEVLVSDQRAYELVESADTFSIRMVSRRFPTANTLRFCAEMFAGGMLKMVRQFSVSVKPLALRLSFAAPEYHTEYARVFGTPAQFDQPVTELVFERALLDQPSAHGDRDLQAALRTVAEERLVRLTRSVPLALRLRTHLLAQMPRRSNMDSAARALQLSSRSLRRQLTHEGTSFREIEYAVLATAAARLLCDQGMTIQQAAYEMGFSDAATFHRAFKTWTGQTPSEYRARVG